MDDNWKKSRREYRTSLICLVVFSTIMAALTVAISVSVDKGRERAESLERQRDLMQAQRDACKDLVNRHVDSLYAASDKIVRHMECPIQCPPPTCAAEAELEDCRRELGWRRQKVDFGDWFVQTPIRTEEKIAPLRAKYSELWEQMLPVKARAKQMGIGPRVREWINNPEAVAVYLELGSRWGEIEYTHSLITQEIQKANQDMEMTCYQNIRQSWEEMVPDNQDYERMRESIYDIVNDYSAMHLFVYELHRRGNSPP